MNRLAACLNRLALEVPLRVSERSWCNGLLPATILSMTLVWAAGVHGSDNSGVTAELRQEAVGLLQRELDEQQRWVKVHAAEYLLALDYTEGIRATFEKELQSHGDEAEYRVGIWRVLARASMRQEDRDKWIFRILKVFLDTAAPDRLHALETLAKLGYKIPQGESAPFTTAAGASRGPVAAYANWALVNAEEKELAKHAEASLAGLLRSDDSATRGTAAYAIRHLARISPNTQAELAAAADEDGTTDSSHGVFVLGAASTHDRQRYLTVWRDRVASYATIGSPGEKYQACEVLASLGDEQDLSLLVSLMAGSEADVRAAAANAVLRIDRRKSHAVPVLDWCVLAVYAVLMLAIGWYYSRQTKTAEDYLLGGRAMKPLSVGLSLFATLLSTISYLTWPGEMIRYGPLFMLGAIASYPFIALVAGWLMIPFIVKLKVTSAYEILESRLGPVVRTVGSLLFLSLRLAWMAVIIFATSDKVLVPLLGWPSSSTPYVCIVLGVITVIYTSMGGLKAVVLTDVIQSLILFGGAILTLLLVTHYLGGVAAWLPSRWPEHWPEPVWIYAPGARTTFFAGFLATFTWYVCTSGSDQMAIQRYLATRDVKAARRVLIISLVASTLVTVIMISVGLAILAFFTANPHMIPDGQTMLSDADTLFPRFIAYGMPMGLSGLVVAGLLAAAMSSLSSGINSSCSVITVDFFERFRPRKNRQVVTDHVKLARYVSVFVGVVVVALSSGVGMVQGNLLEVAFKVVNLLTAPLFGLFFMAMFVRWATATGTLVGAVVGLAVVVAINYWEEITGTKGISFLWGMPLSLAAQIGVGMLVSLLPIGRRNSERPS